MPLFPSTQWSVLAAIRAGDASEKARALETLSAVYWRPVYLYLRTRWERSPEEAADLTQEFFVELLARGLLEKYEGEKGRLRTYLRVCIDGFVANEIRAAERQKRGGGLTFLPIHLDACQDEMETSLSSRRETPEDAFEKEWARSLIGVALKRMKSDFEEKGRSIHLSLFEICDLGTASGETPSYAELAERFGIRTSDVTNWLALARREFRRNVIEVLRELTGSEREFRQELRALSGREAGRVS